MSFSWPPSFPVTFSAMERGTSRYSQHSPSYLGNSEGRTPIDEFAYAGENLLTLGGSPLHRQRARPSR